MTAEMQERSIVNKVSWRLLPFLVLSYLLCYIDRVNLGFAALTMNKDIGLTATAFGWGAGIFFIGYFLFEVPSNLAMQKFGARMWIGRIMISWGILSAAMAMVEGTASFIAMRFLLGAAEAGFFPGVLLYMTYWFPAEYRGVIISRFMFAQPIALMIGSAVSGWLLTLDGVMGVAGWKWLFLIEGIPSVICGIVAFLYLTDKPSQAKWLTVEERTLLQNKIDEEQARVESVRKYSLVEALLNVKVLILGVIYVCIVIGIYGVNIWLPQIVKSMGGQHSSFEIGLLSSIPFLAAAVGMLLIGISSDKYQERKWHMVISILVAGLSLIASAYTSSSIAITIALLSISSICLYGCMPIFWTIPSTFLTGTAAAGGLALINSIGNLGGFAGPFAVGWIKDTTGNFIYGLLFLGCSVVLGSIIGYLLCTSHEREVAALKQRSAQS